MSGPVYSVRCMFDTSNTVSPTDCEGRAVGARLRDLGRTAGLTPADLARELGTTQSAIARMEAGGQRLNLDYVRRVASVLACSVAVVFDQQRRSA